MSIIGRFKRLIFGASAEPVEQVPMRTVPQPVQAQSSKAGHNEPTFSESDMLAVQQRAETVLRAFNESLSIANQSKNREAREDRLYIAREGLVELKQLANKFPFLHLVNLQAVEASLIAVEAETRSLPCLSVRDKQVILMSIQSFFRVINESIKIARKSKNLETKVSRLGVARNSLKEAQKVASQFSLEIEGFDKAEAEINRIDEAIKTGTPTEIPGMQQIDVNTAFSSTARNLLKEATALKREKKYIEACEKLREAYSADGAENLMIKDRLRLPMYLQLAGRNDEGWDELNRLNVRYVDQFSQPIIANQMRVFLQKESNEKATNPVRLILQGENAPMPLSSALERTSVTMGELQNAPIPSWMDDVCSGFKFCATLQLRTPLRVLLRHGEIYLKNDGQQPQIAREPWEGIWLPKLKSWRELGADIDEMAPGTHASDIGPIRPDEYLPFLIAVRRIIEANDPIEHRIEKLREMLTKDEWQKFVSQRGPSHISRSTGVDWIIECFFPRFVGTIPKVPASAENSLSRLGLDTPNRIAAAPDETLLSIKGIGRAKLQAIREHCAGMAENRDADRVENVIR